MRHDWACSETEILSIGNPVHWFSTAKVEAKAMPFLAPFPARGRNVSLQRILEHVSGTVFYSVPSSFPSGETSTSTILPDLDLPFSSMLSCPLNLSL
jgi:hypothetical protein